MATQLSGGVSVSGAPLFSAGGSTIPEQVIGARVEANDGRIFRYCFATPTALVAGQLQQGPAEVTNHQNLTSPVAAIGATSLDITLGATAAGLNQYAGGLAVISVTPGVGYSYKIKSSTLTASSGTITVQLEDPIEIALTGTSRIDLVQNPYNGVIVNPTTSTGPVVGVANDVISAGSYGWIQTGGMVGCLADLAVTVGRNVIGSLTVAGAVTQLGLTSATTRQIVGYAVTGIADTEYGAIHLTLD